MASPSCGVRAADEVSPRAALRRASQSRAARVAVLATCSAIRDAPHRRNACGESCAAHAITGRDGFMVFVVDAEELAFFAAAWQSSHPRRPVSAVGVLEGSTELQAVLYSPDYGEDQDRARTETRTRTRPRTRPGPGPGPGPRTGTRARTRTRTTAGPDPRPGSDRPGPEPRWNPNF